MTEPQDTPDSAGPRRRRKKCIRSPHFAQAGHSSLLNEAPVVRFPDGTEVPLREVAPGKFTADLPEGIVPRYGFVRLLRLPNGVYAPLLKTWHQTVRFSTKLAQSLGLDCDYNTLFRLAKTGFLTAYQVSPGCHLLDLQSLHDHLEACKEPGYWNAKRRAQFREPIL